MILKNLSQNQLKDLKIIKEKEASNCLIGAQDIECADLYLESYSKIKKEISEIDNLIIK